MFTASELSAVSNEKVELQRDDGDFVERRLVGQGIPESSSKPEENNRFSKESSSSRRCARRRWNLLSKYVRKRSITAKSDSLSVLQLFTVVNIDNSTDPSWYRYSPSTFRDVFVDIHFPKQHVTLNELVGFDNSGNVRIWPSEEFLAYFLMVNRRICLKKVVLELGSGVTGLAGFTAAKIGADKVYITDGNEKSIENLRLIAERNFLKDLVDCSCLMWGCEYRDDISADIILCADCLFYRDVHVKLINCIHSYLNPGGFAYLIAPNRGDTFADFVKLLNSYRNSWKRLEIIYDFSEYSVIQKTFERLKNDPEYDSDKQQLILLVIEKL